MREGSGFRDRKAEFDAKGAVILGASFDGREANAAFAAKYGFGFSLLCDTDRRLGLAYGAADPGSTGAARRISYLIDRDGTIAAVWPKVKSGEFPAEVLALL